MHEENRTFLNKEEDSDSRTSMPRMKSACTRRSGLKFQQVSMTFVASEINSSNFAVQRTDRLYGLRGDPDRITVPVRRQMAVSAFPASSLSSMMALSLPFTLFTRP